MATCLSRLLCVLIVLFGSSNAYINYHEESPISDVCKGTPNKLTPWTGDLVKVTSVTNGVLYTAGSGDDKINVVHVYGSAHEMGYAFGQLLKPQIQKLLPSFLKHVDEEVEAYLKDLPKELQDIIAELGVDAALDLTHLMTMEYTPQYFYDEMAGLAEATGLPYNQVVRVHMLPELVKAGCSMLGGWGKSTSGGAGFVQLRALDWDTDGPLQDAPTVVVYHPDDGHSFVNVGWAGWIGTISGMSSKGIAVSEKHSDIPFASESRIGIPFNFLMRDILQFDNNLSDSIRRIQEARRTCSIWLGVGDASADAFRLFEYSESTAKVFDDRNITGINASRYHKEGCGDSCIANYSMADLVYWGVHLGCWSKELHEAYGQLSPTKVIELVGTVQTGNLQAVVYDMKEMAMYVSNAKASYETGPLNAYDRRFVKLDLKQLFSEPRPGTA